METYNADVRRIMEIILKQGCNSSLEELEGSELYSQLKMKYGNEPLPKGYGYLETGLRLNGKEPFDTGKNFQYGYGRELNALIEAVGIKILESAKACLPKEALVIAEQWKKASANKQIALAKKLYVLFTSKEQCKKDFLGAEGMLADVLKDWQINYGASAPQVLPNLYGPWNRKNNTANCQGKTQMLVAFAKLVGVKIMIGSPRITALGVIDGELRKYKLKILQDFKEREIEFPDSAFMESFVLEKFFETESFHLCLVLQVRDGRWVIIDSNALNFGVLTSEEWGLDSVYETLSEYDTTLPGMALVSAAPQDLENKISEMVEKADSFIERAHKLQDLIGRGDEYIGIDSIIELYANGNNFLEDLYFLNKRKKMPEYDIVIRRHLASVLWFGEDILSFATQIMRDRTLWRKKKESMLTAYHVMALDSLATGWHNGGGLIHPEIYFSGSVPYNIAMSAINSISSDTDLPLRDFALDYSFCQVALSNAIRDKNVTVSEEAVYAAELIKYPHKIIEKHLRDYHFQKQIK